MGARREALKWAKRRIAVDEERRRWYAALEQEFGLPRNSLEGFAPEVAADTVRRFLAG